MQPKPRKPPWALRFLAVSAGGYFAISVGELIRYLVRAAGANANLLLNVGPMPNGKIQPEAVQRLQEMGAWLAKYGDSIYGTRSGPISPRTWGVTTRKDNRIFIHILDWQDDALLLPRIDTAIKRAYLMRTGQPVTIVATDYGSILRLPTYDKTAPDNVVVLEIAHQ